MKRILFFALVCAFFNHGLYAQNVDSIRVEQAGDLIKIHYKILNSNQYQTFKVTVSAKINGGLESKLESLIGDVGDAVKGGKDSYIVIWDVLKDVDEIETVDFIVKAELVKGDVSPDGPKPVKISKKRFYLLAVGLSGPLNQQFGGRIGFMGDFGFSFSYLSGKKDYKDYTGEPYYGGFTSSVNITKRIINNPDFQFHLLTGATLANHESTDPLRESRDIMVSGLDIGLIAGFKRLALYAGYSRAKKPFMSEYDSDGTTWFNFGAGFRF